MKDLPLTDKGSIQATFQGVKMEHKETILEVLNSIISSLDKDDVDLSSHVISLRGLDSVAFLPCSGDNNVDQLAELEDLEKAYIQLGKSLYNYGAVKWFKGREDTDFVSDDFQGTAKRAEFALCVFQLLMQKLCSGHGATNYPDVYKRVTRTLCKYWMLLIAEHSNEQFMWSNSAAKEAATKSVECLCELFSGTTEEILINPKKHFSGGLLTPIFKEIRPLLSKECWKQNPSLKHVYYWLLTNVKSPHVGEHLDLLFPPPLMFLDHHQVENKVIGVKCLRHILSETSSSEIQWYGRSDVMYQVLQHQLYQHEPELLQEVLPCLHALLKITELSPSNQKITEEDRFDEIMPRLLSDMETETRIVVRREYTKHLGQYVESLGIRNVKYYKRLLRVISSYLEVYDGPEEVTRLNILDCLVVVIKVTWPRVPSHCSEICKMVIRLLWDVGTDNSLTPISVKDDLFRKVESCLTWTRRAASQQTDEIVTSILQIESIPAQVQKSLNGILVTT